MEIDKTDKIYTDKNLKPVYNVIVSEQILNPKGELVEEKKQKHISSFNFKIQFHALG